MGVRRACESHGRRAGNACVIMILQSVPTEDFEEFENEDGVRRTNSSEDTTTLYGLSSNVEPKKKNSAKRKMQKVQKAAHKIAERAENNYKITLLTLCCCLGTVGIGASLTLLSRYAAENAVPTAPARADPVLAVFSYANSSTNAALAALVATILDTGQLNTTGTSENTRFSPGARRSPFIPDGSTVKVWRPDGKNDHLRAFAHGEVSRKLRRIHNLAPPQVQDLTLSPGTGEAGQALAQATLEADAFLEMHRLFEGGGGGATGRTAPESAEAGGSAEIVLISHPHHLPYLMALAWASGFRAYTLDPSVYSGYHWDEFECSPFGYPSSTPPREGVEHEMRLFKAFLDMLRQGDPRHYASLQPIIRAANATLTFYRCTADLGADVQSSSIGQFCVH